MIDTNQNTYSSSKAVMHYSEDSAIQKPELKIFDLLKGRLKDMRMLDVGVGAGRTTTLFADKVMEYKAIDYSGEMISFCKNRFKHIIPEENFCTADARDLSVFPADYFDFVLFSFNGIDYATPDGREKIFSEIKCKLKKSGIFCFSSHNLLSLKNWMTVEFSFNPRALIYNTVLYLKRKQINKLDNSKIREIEKLDYVILNDGAHEWGLQTFFVSPAYQINYLQSIGYKKIKVFNLKQGRELSQKELLITRDKWLYYLCHTE